MRGSGSWYCGLHHLPTSGSTQGSVLNILRRFHKALLLTMAVPSVPSKPKLCERLSCIFSKLFVDDAEVLGVIHDFLLSKKVIKSSRMVVGKVGCGQDCKTVTKEVTFFSGKTIERSNK